MIAFHFPPMQGSSGLQRTLKFARYLPDHGWQPIVLSAGAGVYQATSDAQLNEIGSTAVVRRAFALDAARHLAIHGAYPSWLALPDRWASWWLGAVPAGLALIRRYRPDVIWSTFPIATAHLIGLTLARMSGLPWVADFRVETAPAPSGAVRPIQIASFSKEENATRAVQALAKIGITAQIQKSDKGGKIVWGIVASGDAAMLQSIKDAGFADAYFLK